MVSRGLGFARFRASLGFRVYIGLVGCKGYRVEGLRRQEFYLPGTPTLPALQKYLRKCIWVYGLGCRV